MDGKYYEEMKIYYRKQIEEWISKLIEEKDSLVDMITEDVSYISFEKDSQDMSNWEINNINKTRNKIGAIYKLIEDLDKLLK